MRRLFLRHLLTLIAASLPIYAHGAAPAAPARPNVLFIAFDDLRDWLGYLGHTQAKTPNFDRLAQRGTAFTRSYAISTVCNPSRAAVLLGQRPGTSGIYGNNTDWRAAAPGIVTLPRHFKAHGYTVLGAGKISHDTWQQPADWDEFHQAPTVGNWQQRALERDGKLPPGAFNVGRDVVTPLDIPDSEHSDHANTSWAISQLQRRHSQPLFLALGIRKPHPLFEVPRRYFDLYPLEKIQLPKVNDRDRDDLPKGGLRMAGSTEEHDDIVKAGKWRELVQAYLACISFADAQLGRMLAAETARRARPTSSSSSPRPARRPGLRRHQLQPAPPEGGLHAAPRRLAREACGSARATSPATCARPPAPACSPGATSSAPASTPPAKAARGMAQTETIFPKFLKPAGYVSSAFGKWHLGLTVEQSPVGRGFDEWYGFLGRGAHDYFDLAQNIRAHPMYRNGQGDQGRGLPDHAAHRGGGGLHPKTQGGPFYVTSPTTPSTRPRRPPRRTSPASKSFPKSPRPARS
jgi:arylsulfatase A-like enzyme